MRVGRSRQDDVPEVVPVHLLVGPVEAPLSLLGLGELVQFGRELLGKCLFRLPRVESPARILEQEL